MPSGGTSVGLSGGWLRVACAPGAHNMPYVVCCAARNRHRTTFIFPGMNKANPFSIIVTKQKYINMVSIGVFSPFAKYLL